MSAISSISYRSLICDAFLFFQPERDYIRFFVLDEADEMLSRGFKDQIYDIFRLLNNDIQVDCYTISDLSAFLCLVLRCSYCLCSLCSCFKKTQCWYSNEDRNTQGGGRRSMLLQQIALCNSTIKRQVRCAYCGRGMDLFTKDSLLDLPNI